MFPFSGALPIGIDIGAYSLKAVKLRGRPGAFSLEAAVCVRFKTVGAHKDEAASGLIAEVVRSQRISGKKAATALSGPSLILRQMNLPSMPEKDMREAVKWELRKEIAAAPDDLTVDYVFSNSDDGAENARSLIAFAARKGEVSRLMTIFGNAGIDLRVVEAEPMALLNAFDMNNVWEAGVNYAMIDIGSTKSFILIFKDRRLCFAREIVYGAQDLITSLSGGLGKEPDEAAAYMSAFGLQREKGADKNAYGIIAGWLEGLIGEIQRSLDYYHAQFRKGAVSKIFLSGAMAAMKGLDDTIAGASGISAFVHDPFKKVRIPGRMDTEALRAVAPALNVAAGLAGRTLEE